MTVIEAQAPPAVGRDVEEVLRAGGLSSFHRKAILVTGVAWTFVAMEILLVGFVAPVFAGLWHLNGVMLGLVNSAALAGSLVGSLVLGRTADRIGRRRIFQLSILWYAVFTACTALSWGPWSVMTFRFLAGLGLGGMLVVDPSMLAEYLPPQRRGACSSSSTSGGLSGCCWQPASRTSSSARPSTASVTGAGATCSSPLHSL